jgi:hypothetical protein
VRAANCVADNFAIFRPSPYAVPDAPLRKPT